MRLARMQHTDPGGTHPLPNPLLRDSATLEMPDSLSPHALPAGSCTD
jgi:hypothetical protein